jgi:hypothetical protein
MSDGPGFTEGESGHQVFGRLSRLRSFVDVRCLHTEIQAREGKKITPPGGGGREDYPTNGSKAFPRTKSLTRIVIEVITTVRVVARPTPSVPPRV